MVKLCKPKNSKDCDDISMYVISYWNGHNLFVQPASSRLSVRISLTLSGTDCVHVKSNVIRTIVRGRPTLLRNTLLYTY